MGHIFVTSFKILFVVLMYVALAKLGLDAALVNKSVSLFWPAAGFAVASCLTFGYWMLLAVFVGALITNYTTTFTIWPSLLIAGGNMLEALITAELYKYRVDARPWHSEAVRLLLCCIPGAAVAATVGAAVVATTSNIEPVVWIHWFSGDYLGMVLFIPVFLYVRKLT
jgi:integral membrane sensor domain MASE1